MLSAHRNTFIFLGSVIFCVAILSGCSGIDPALQEAVWGGSTGQGAADGQTLIETASTSSADSTTAAAETPKAKSNISTTGLGALTGAAVGGGIGLVIGSTTGAAGEGLALGSMAGAVAGTGFGYGVQKQEEKLASNRQRVTDQEKMISEQSRNLQELRRGAQDMYPISEFNRPSLNPGNRRGYKTGGQVPSTAVSASDMQRSRMQNAEPISVTDLQTPPRAVTAPAAVANQPESNVPAYAMIPPPLITPPKATLPGAASADAPQQMAANHSSRTIEHNLPLSNTAADPVPVQPRQPAVISPSNALPPANMLPPAKTEAEDNEEQAVEQTESEEMEVAAAVSLEPPKVQAAPVQAPAKLDSVSAPVRTAPLPSAEIETPAATKPAEPGKQRRDALSDDLAKSTVASKTVMCPDAEQEASRARSATSDADKLFYFRRAIRLCPEKPDYYVEIGRVYVAIGRTQDAQSEFGKALEIDPEHERAQEELNMIMLGAAY